MPEPALPPGVLRELAEKFGPFCLFNESARAFTTYQAGGKAAALVKPADAAGLAWLAACCRRHSLPLAVLGRGSNVLVSDLGFAGVVALTGRLDALEFSGHTVKAGAGVAWDELARLTAEKGLAGFEKTSGIPGSVGGAVHMNAGAFGQETFDRLVSVEAQDPAGKIVVLEKNSLPHGYRRVPGLDGLVVLGAVFNFEAAEPAALLAERARVLAARAAKQPLDLPSAGSVFKRPPGDYASRLIDAAGLKGLRLGGAQVSSKHAGFIVNAGNASASDIFGLMQKVRAEVKAKTGVELELEQVLLGEFPEDEAAA
ncbi:MAG TPA: UDP-N-acetylmuramate dehydrogenase [Elusimicrobiales bacterium]|nr:UDP-N-acetylmuramate dehydrogenase [Elusimicrobiales bacterium]